MKSVRAVVCTVRRGLVGMLSPLSQWKWKAGIGRRVGPNCGDTCRYTCGLSRVTHRGDEDRWRPGVTDAFMHTRTFNDCYKHIPILLVCLRDARGSGMCWGLEREKGRLKKYRRRFNQHIFPC